MQDDFDLFPPFSNDDTSEAAAHAAASWTAELRGRVFLFMACKPNGCTDDEMLEGLPCEHQTGTPRRWELSRKLGLLTDSGKRRPTRAGRAAIVWIPTRLGELTRDAILTRNNEP